MKFLLADQDVYALTVRFLLEEGHDVVTAADLGFSRASDEKLLKEAKRLGRIMLTRDRDYGTLVFIRKIKVGVIYLRVLPSNIEAVHKNLAEILQIYAQEELSKTFISIDAKQYRVRKLG